MRCAHKLKSTFNGRIKDPYKTIDVMKVLQREVGNWMEDENFRLTVGFDKGIKGIGLDLESSMQDRINNTIDEIAEKTG